LSFQTYQLLKLSSPEPPDVQGPRTQPRKPPKFREILYAVGRHKEEALESVERIDLDEAEPVWRRVASMSRRRRGLDIALSRPLPIRCWRL
ncbi:hypothetical protein COOONC_22975, partial [Cooperia oncophora]